MSKGSRPRPYSVTQQEYDQRWDTIFGRDKNNEIGGCGCGRSPTGKCIGWHGLTEDEFQAKLTEYNSSLNT